ncbi:hypothetical protein TSUD_25320 [Trifolium subterraneum]|uniref:ABC transmembrane type-1 domain-containing protein n=1 Tax=Trifolium subterraneum TaxID=3900 RepID=A0A2Z6P3E9_TRISU|nr:hypothetical protein TSUD_25320 [Trifolium subterraneum]
MPISYSYSSLSISSSILPKLNPNLRPIQFRTKQQYNRQFPNLKIQNSSTTNNTTIQFLKPYLISQQKPILFGWLCSAISVYSLSNILSKFSAITTTTTTVHVTHGFALGGLVLVRLIAKYAQHALLWEASLNAVYDVRVHVFDRVFNRELAFFEANDAVSTGDIAYRITAEASDLAVTLYALLNTIVPSTLQLSAMIMHMLVISPSLSLISAMVIPCMVLVVAFLGQELRKISKKSHTSVAALSAYLNEILPAILFVKANNAELLESVRFKRLALIDNSAKLNKKRMKAVIPQVIQAIYFGVLSILCAGSAVISRGSFDRCSLVQFVSSLLFLIEPIQDVGKAYNEWRQGEPAIERLFAMTQFKNKVVEKPDAVDLDHVTGELKFCSVSFKYNDGLPLILNELNLHVRPGETVAIVGPSGGGKTTLAKLLLRLYDPISGAILIDNQNTQNISLQSLRRHVGVVSQDITLFSGTVAENIGYRDMTTKIDMERVKHVAQTAYADEFISKLPEGYKTNIGPRGSTLSGGQRQSIWKVLVISHRLETVMMAKRIFLLDNGKLEELPRSTMLDGHMDSLLSSGQIV